MEKDNWPKKKLSRPLIKEDEMKVYNNLLHNQYRWRKLVTIMRHTDFSEEKVNEILKKLEKEELARKASYLSIDGKEMWGATANVGNSP